MKKILPFLFMLTALSVLKASDTLTVRQVFNFNVGDTFDYTEYTFNQCANFSNTSYVRKVVIQKSYSINQDTIYYQYNFPLGSYWYTSQFFNKIQFDTITNLDSPAIYLLSSNGCNPPIYDTTIYWGYSSDSITIGCFESAGFSTFTNRLGMTYSSGVGGGDPCGNNGNTYKLIHFANDSMHLGFDILDEVSNLSNTSSIRLYPNPSNDILHLSISSINGSAYQLILTDILGQGVYSSSITQSETTHDISGLSSGIYTWRISPQTPEGGLNTNSNGSITTGKVIKE